MVYLFGSFPKLYHASGHHIRYKTITGFFWFGSYEKTKYQQVEVRESNHGFYLSTCLFLP